MHYMQCWRMDLLHSTMFPNELRFRQTAIEEMRRLVDKYPDGFQI